MAKRPYSLSDFDEDFFPDRDESGASKIVRIDFRQFRALDDMGLVYATISSHKGQGLSPDSVANYLTDCYLSYDAMLSPEIVDAGIKHELVKTMLMKNGIATLEDFYTKMAKESPQVIPRLEKPQQKYISLRLDEETEGEFYEVLTGKAKPKERAFLCYIFAKQHILLTHEDVYFDLGQKRLFQAYVNAYHSAVRNKTLPVFEEYINSTIRPHVVDSLSYREEDSEDIKLTTLDNLINGF